MFSVTLFQHYVTLVNMERNGCGGCVGENSVVLEEVIYHFKTRFTGLTLYSSLCVLNSDQPTSCMVEGRSFPADHIALQKLYFTM